MPRWQTIGLSLGLILCFCSAPAVASPDNTVVNAQTVLKELLSTPGRGIPARLLQDSHAVAIIPGVIKIGFIGGVRRGHGVVLIRDKDGDWGAPQFVTITGGSVGWQIGAQSTDVVLLFQSERSVQNLMKGKFTIGADAAASAGPVGRNVAAATDAQLKAEILSYSRSRGLFAGVSLDGSVLEIDQRATSEFYGSRPGELPARVPQSAIDLIQAVASVTNGGSTEEGAARAEQPVVDRDALRAAVATNSLALQKLLQPEWQKFLALPPEVYTTTEHPSVDLLDRSLANFRVVAGDRQYATLQAQPAFPATLEALEAYRAALAQAPARLQLPPPPR